MDEELRELTKLNQREKMENEKYDMYIDKQEAYIKKVIMRLIR